MVPDSSLPHRSPHPTLADLQALLAPGTHVGARSSPKFPGCGWSRSPGTDGPQPSDCPSNSAAVARARARNGGRARVRPRGSSRTCTADPGPT